jgi:hypothetical protein
MREWLQLLDYLINAYITRVNVPAIESVNDSIHANPYLRRSLVLNLRENGRKRMHAIAKVTRRQMYAKLATELHEQAFNYLMQRDGKEPRFGQIIYQMLVLASQMDIKEDARKLGCSPFIRNTSSENESRRAAIALFNRTYRMIGNGVDTIEDVTVQTYDGILREATVINGDTPYDGFHRDDTSRVTMINYRGSKVGHSVNKYVKSQHRARIFYVEGVACVNY